jgi:hypothetical protein
MTKSANCLLPVYLESRVKLALCLQSPETVSEAVEEIRFVLFVGRNRWLRAACHIVKALD